MKKTLVVMIVLASLSTSLTSIAATFTCKSIPEAGTLGRTTYSVVIKELKRLPAKVTPRKYDYAISVDVTVSQSLARSPGRKIISKGTTTALVEDVLYKIESKELGISFLNFLDDMEAILTLDGSKKMSLTCEESGKQL